MQQEASAKDSALAAMVESQQMLQSELQQALDRLQTADQTPGEGKLGPARGTDPRSTRLAHMR